MTVKLFTIRDIIQAAPVGEWARSIKWPILSREAIDENGISEPAPQETQFLLIQPQAPVAFEVFFEGQEAVPPTSLSPVLYHETIIQYGPGWRISVSEVA